MTNAFQAPQNILAVSISLTLSAALLSTSTQVWSAQKTPFVTGSGGAVATINEHATQSAIDILNRGGNAIDAAVAAAATLGVTDPFSCGIGGGGFMLIYLAKENRFITLDHRETAPAGFRSDAFMRNGKAIAWEEAVNSGMAVGVPGTVRGWDEALTRYGRLSFKQVLAPAIQVAQKGFTVTPIFHHLNQGAVEKFARYTSSSALYLHEGKALPIGFHFKNPDLAKTYRIIAQAGVNGFYRGPVAQGLLQTVNQPPAKNGVQVVAGNMNSADLQNYEARWRLPVRSTYRGLDLVSMGLPSSGGITVAEALNILENFDTKGMSRQQIEHLYLEAARLAFADRNAYLGDPEFVDVPVAGLLDKAYAKQRATLISSNSSMSRDTPTAAGDPYAFQNDPSVTLRPQAPTNKLQEERKHTTHLTVSDKEGNIVAYTYTIEDWGGNGMVVPGYGFLLNNELTDFDFTPPHPNIPEAGKRPRSSIAPFIAMKNGKPVFTIGSPGGSTIITTVLQSIVNHVDMQMPMVQAIAAPRLSERNEGKTQVEPNFIHSAQAVGLALLGHVWQIDESDPEIGAANAIVFHTDGTVTAVSEPQRHGVGSAKVQKKAH
ncbi:gamma-glutamyltransferase [Undibacterium sp. LX40W]|uniref:Glutathione hydrolase proenzyme n=1 Tax=Undibacterium nitidum TaxID=2762298 RepID=A0A923HMX1_9BURK|nr:MULTISPECIES: gamma-glutamyltransferase [Undibacterium]MBC3881997.1 gamma-glutamyltransferase [Undibacterium nitidum]MBC3892007.1 gamma-glutamyltransferase [Undibacterium sp. LX40W]